MTSEETKAVTVDNIGNGNDNNISKLLDTTYPLLARFRELCPGTYKHSQALASMIEGVSISLDLDI